MLVRILFLINTLVVLYAYPRMPYVKHIRRSFLLLSVITNTLASKEIKEKKGSTYKETHTHTNIFTNSLSLSVN